MDLKVLLPVGAEEGSGKKGQHGWDQYEERMFIGGSALTDMEMTAFSPSHKQNQGSA